MDTKKLRQKILDLAIHGKLVPQDPNDEPASVLLERIRKEKEQLIKEGKIKAPKKSKSAGDTSHYPKEWPFDVPEGWCWTTIGECLINRDGERVPLSSNIRMKQKNKVYDYYGAAGIIDKVDGYLFNERLLLIGEDGANLLSRVKDNAFFAEGKYWVNNHAHVIDATRKPLLNYIELYINSISLDPYITGSAQPKLNQDNLNSIPVPLPPFREQCRIKETIEKWQTLIDVLHDYQNELFENITQIKSKVLDLAIHGKLVPQEPSDEPAIEQLKRVNPSFHPSHNLHYGDGVRKGWIRLRLSEAFEINPKVTGKDDEACAFVPMAMIPGGYSHELRFERKPWAEIKKGFTRFSEGDIGVAKISPCLENRKSVIFRGLPSGRGAGSTELIIFRPILVTAEYGLIFFKSGEFIANCERIYNGVVGQQRVDMSEIRGMYINIPPISEQNKIVRTVELLFHYLDIIQRSNHL